MHATTAFLAYEHGLVLFQRQISILLDCFCIGSMVMPRVWLIYFWAGLCTSFFLSVFFLLVLCGLSCIRPVYSLFFWSIYGSLSIKKKNILCM